MNRKRLLDMIYFLGATVCQCLHDFSTKPKGTLKKRKRNSIWRHFKSNSKRKHVNQIRIIQFFLWRSEKAPKANIYPLLWVVARPAWLTLNKSQAAGEQAPVSKAMTTENVALNWSWLKMYKYINISIKAAKHTRLELLVFGLKQT